MLFIVTVVTLSPFVIGVLISMSNAKMAVGRYNPLLDLVKIDSISLGICTSIFSLVNINITLFYQGFYYTYVSQ